MELNTVIKEAKHKYKVKVENMFNSNNSKEAWKGLKYLSGYVTKNTVPEPDNIQEFVENINIFYARFDDKDFSVECDSILDTVKNMPCERIELTENDIKLALNTAKPGKAPGPDKIGGKVIKYCKDALVVPVHKLYQDSLDQCIVPSQWKTSVITPAPKVKHPLVENDLRPIALTDVLMKCLEFLVKRYLCHCLCDLLDNRQFAYVNGKCVDDAVITLLDLICAHLENPKSYSRVLYVDFSSAFNTIQPHVLLNKLLALNVNRNIIRWIYSYLTSRPQFVRLNGIVSNCILTNTGAPQGCVLSPLLFTIYTNDCRSHNENCTIIKYADDTVIVGNIFNNDESLYREQVDAFVHWCNINYLNLNVKKTKEMIFDFRRAQAEHYPLVISEESVELVQSYKYLGVIVDEKLTFTENVHHVYVKCIKRLHYLRILKNIQVDMNILSLFYRSVVESVIMFAIITWFGSSFKKDQNKLCKLVRAAKKMGVATSSLNVLYDRQCMKMITKILKDDSHPLHFKFKYLRSGKRLCVPKHHTKRYANTFVPHAIKLYNHNSCQ